MELLLLFALPMVAFAFIGGSDGGGGDDDQTVDGSEGADSLVGTVMIRCWATQAMT